MAENLKPSARKAFRMGSSQLVEGVEGAGVDEYGGENLPVYVIVATRQIGAADRHAEGKRGIRIEVCSAREGKNGVGNKR